MEKKKNVSMAVIKRMPKYYRYLGELVKNDVDRISSKELGEKIGFTASQIRQDLNNFGDFGQQGYGYNVKELHNQIGAILGVGKEYNAVLIGAGNIGQAIANYSRFTDIGLGITDIDELKGYLEENHIDMGILCVPRINAQKVCDVLVNGGVRGIWNFAPIDLHVPETVKVENVHLSESLLTLVYQMNK